MTAVGGTMSTTVNINLSTALQTTLASPSAKAYAYVFAFGASTLGGPVELIATATLVENGVGTGGSITLPSPNFYSGNIFVVIQQDGDGNLPNHISSIGDITTKAAEYNYSYQMFEATLSGSGNDQGDISALNTLGFASTLEVVYQDGTDTRGFNVDANSIFSWLPPEAILNYDPNHFPNPIRIANGPATANNEAPWAGSGWQTYVDALKSDPATLSAIQIVYAFQGGSTLQEDAMLSQYGVQYVASDQYGDDYFWLVPDTSNGATNTDWIRIPVSQLVDNIFVQGGSVEVHQGGKGGNVVYYDSFTPDNAVGGVAKHFVAGFDAGYWGGQGVSANGLDNQVFDFNKGYNWNVNYAYNAILLDGVGSADFYNYLMPANPSASDFFYDPWAQQILVSSNAYGYSYSDLVSAGGVNPQISLWDPAANANVGTINITIFDNGEIPPSGYKASSTGYIAPGINGYEAATTANTNNVGFSFNFGVGSTIYAPDANTPIVFKIYAPGAAGADSDGFISLNLTGANGNWYYYEIVADATNTWSYNYTNPTDEAGFFNIFNLPGTADGSAAWYQLVFGGTGAQSIYNIYALTDVGNGITELVIDHGVEVTYTSANQAYTLSFAPGGHMFYDIGTFAPPPTDDPDAPGVTIFGSKQSDMVNALNSVGTQPVPTGGADIIYGGKGDDFLSGLAGNDILNGDKGVDTLYGGDGDDILQVRGKEGINDVFLGGNGTDTLQFVGKGGVTLAGFTATSSSIEILEGNGRGLVGTKQMDVFDLSGLSQIDSLPFVDGKGGNDILIGSNFDDVLRGGKGDDVLDGRGGNDILDGGKGRNTYVFADGYDNDTIAKYQAGNAVVDLTGVSSVSDFSGLAQLMQQEGKNVVIDFGNGDSLTLQKTTIALLTANQGDFLFS
ncbi:calcium-binding protein [Pseudorhodoplanes sp.]|uniref:calcium-binding protein n=1 Tax=Pseudorhodoplanes sp. TaxID=1934341 RepID=UPI00391AD5E2